ncbi:guanylate kinase [Chytriomyces confervae]|uniref:Guanylate kinase n=1 Tax=Chytriomyces confervae TaxID=246404 RepID=A0A507EZL3_9FUNG|nr:hypothetical protein HDU80_005945 [Chytriomyces hyalinus]TPX68817.1 guanylate kinase [Chytriomyces confervae]
MAVTFDSTSEMDIRCSSYGSQLYEGMKEGIFNSHFENDVLDNDDNGNDACVAPRIAVTPELLKRGLGELGRSPDGQSQVFLKLAIPNESLNDISALEPYQFIQNLNLSGNLITDLSCLSSMRYLVKLDVSNNKLSEVLDFYPPPFNLQEMDFSHNQIYEIRDLSEHRFLKSVRLDSNYIQEITGLDECRFLTNLSLSFNEIKRISNLDDLPIKCLDLRSNRLESLEGIETLSDLEDLQLSNNNIRKLSSLNPNHKFLRRLDLDCNDIDEPEQITHLKSTLKMLTELSFRDNPIVMPPAPVIPGVTVSETNSSVKSALLQSGSAASSASSTSALTRKSSTKRRPETSTSTNSETIAHNNRLATAFQLQSLTVLDAKPLTVEEKVAAVNAFNPSPGVVASLQHSCLLKRQAKLYAKVKAEDLMRATHLRPIVLCGPSGAGKRTLTNRLLKDFPHIYGCSVSHTTRKPRIGEEQGTHYHFVTKHEMEAMIEEGKFAEVVTLFGYMYGTSMEAIDKVTEEGKVCIMDLEIEGVLALKRSHLKPLYIFITVPSLEVLKNRLEKRFRPSTAHRTSETQTNYAHTGITIPENSTAVSSPDQSRPSSGLDRPLSGLPPGISNFSRPINDSSMTAGGLLDSRPMSAASNRSSKTTAPTTAGGLLDDDGIRRMILQKGDGNSSLLNLVTGGYPNSGLVALPPLVKPTIGAATQVKPANSADGAGAAAPVPPSLMTEEQFQENVQKWMAKAPGVQSYADLQDFFDLKIMNDDPERAYAELRDFCLTTYIKCYNESDN